MDHDMIFLVLDREEKPVLISVIEEYNDEGLLAEKFPQAIYFYATLEC